MSTFTVDKIQLLFYNKLIKLKKRSTKRYLTNKKAPSGAERVCMPIDNNQSRLKEVRICKLIVTKTLVGDGTPDSLVRNVFQIWSKTGVLLATLDYDDLGYNAISGSFSDSEAFH